MKRSEGKTGTGRRRKTERMSTRIEERGCLFSNHQLYSGKFCSPEGTTP